MRRFIPLAIVLAWAIAILGADIASAQTYTSGSTIIQNSAGIYWCTGATAIFKDTAGNVNWNAACPSTAGASQVWINGVAQVAVPTYSAPVTYSQPVTYAQPTNTVVVVADPCAGSNNYGYTANFNPYGFGYGNPLGYGASYGIGNGCGMNYGAGFGCLALNCRGFSTFPRACSIPGSCGQGRPPRGDHDHDCVPSTTITCH